MRLKEPFLIVNFKTYESGTGKNGEIIADVCKAKEIVLAVQSVDIHRIASRKTTVFAQHIDPIEQGKNTGFLTAEAVKSAGAKGTILNHAEHKIPMDVLVRSVERASQNGLITVACAATPEDAMDIARNCTPDYIAIEPPALISGNISVSKANPGIITNTINSVHKIKPIPIICGAGICGMEDASAAIRLGAKGILVANFVMSAKDKKQAVDELLEGIKMV